MGYMQGVTKKGIDLVSRITGLLNELTAEDFEDTHVGLRVSLMEEDLSRELGFWSLEYDYGNWAFFDGARSDIEARKSDNTVSVDEVSEEDGDEGEPVRYAIKDSTDLLDEGVPSWRAEDLAAKITRMLMRTWEYEEDIRSRDYLPELTLKFEQDGNILTVEGDIRGVKR